MAGIAVTRANFEDVVLKGSATRPVLVDFWASWCAPCRALAPALDRIATELGGRFTLAKLDTEAEPELAARYGIRGIPHCKLFVDGEVRDEFTGALPESAVRQFLDRALPSPAAALIEAAQAMLSAHDATGALAKLDQAQSVDPDREDVLAARAEALLALGRIDEANAAIERVEATARRLRDPRRIAALKARIALGGDGARDLDALARRAAAQPVDCEAKLAYARALAASDEYERALAELLAIVRTDRGFDEDVGRRTMLTIFEALPPDSDLVRRYRRELSAAIN